jgi:aspartate carbamoyltransferase
LQTQKGLGSANKEKKKKKKKVLTRSRFLLRSQNVISAEQFDANSIRYVMSFASRINKALEVVPELPLLRGKVLANCFLEPSTRTATSFHVAMLRLGGSVVSLNQENSSVQKGETLEDTVRMLESYADVMVIRHPTQGAADVAASVLKRLPLINAGDGGGEHPTQALLDLFCIHETFGSLDAPITLTLLGDLKFGRTVHSLAQMVSHFPNIKLNLVSPSNLQMPKHYTDILEARKCKYEVFDRLEPVLGKTDVLYQTRVQKERFTDLEEYQRSKGIFVITGATMAKMKKNSILLHPFPRVDEITEDVDADHRAMYFKQPLYGVRMRMALLSLVLGAEHKL